MAAGTSVPVRGLPPLRRAPAGQRRVIPNWYTTILLGLAAFRATRLVGWDTITRAWRIRWLTHRAEVDGTVYIGPGAYRPRVDEFVHCPWCLGFWVSLAWWLGWWAEPRVVGSVAVWFALSAIVGLVAKNWDA